MDNFIDTLVEKCAGRSASTRLHHRLLEQQHKKKMALATTTSVPDNPLTASTQVQQLTTQDPSPISVKKLESLNQLCSVRPTLHHRINSYIPEPARRPRFQ